MGAIADSYLKPLMRRTIGAFLNIARRGTVDYGLVSLKARIGKGVGIAAGCRIDGMSSIGAYSYVGVNSFVTRAMVGRYCSIANGVAVGPGEHALDRVSTSSLFYDGVLDELTSAPCEVGNDVWVGSGSIIRRGVMVGNGAIVGANSFVRENVPAFAIVAGSPARLIRFRFSEEQRDAIEASHWWDLEPSLARPVLRRLEVDLGLRTRPNAPRSIAVPSGQPLE